MMTSIKSNEMRSSGFLAQGCWAALADWDVPLEIARYYPWPDRPCVLLVGRDMALLETCPERYRGRLSHSRTCQQWTINAAAEFIVAAGPTKDDVLRLLGAGGMGPIPPQPTYPEGRPDFDPGLGVQALARRYLDAGLSVLPIDRPGVSGG